MSAMSKIVFDHALLPGGWAADAVIEIGADGGILSVGQAGRDGAERVAGIAVPGLPNVHSHAFQRAMAGLTEIAGESADNFWSWRELMYRFLAQLTPDDVEAIAALAYVEMLEAGFTAVGEFHYLHHQPDGRPYARVGEMAERIAAATAASGIGLTLLPVFYAQGGFGGAPLNPRQRRFATDVPVFERLMESAQAVVARLPGAALGVAPHSLRAVTPDQLKAVLAIRPKSPVHIHAAEQIGEVEDCLSWSGRRPVEWLLGQHRVDEHWCLVHATHMSPGESAALAATGAVAGLCPITEANLGDGIFDGVNFLAAKGRIAIGTDSNVRLSAAEELRQLEYSQRLRDRARNRLVMPGGSTGRRIFEAALTGGAQAMGRSLGRIDAGARADFVVLDADHPAMVGKSGDFWLDGWIFAGGNAVVRETWVGGKRLVAEGRHAQRDAVRRRFRATVERLTAA
jgi:formimidoylglutamate deiminase